MQPMRWDKIITYFLKYLSQIFLFRDDRSDGVIKKIRHQQVVQLVEQYDVITVAELARLLDVSLETIRRDLAQLQEQGLIERRHGRARKVVGRTEVDLLSGVCQ
jgi:Fic family protein